MKFHIVKPPLLPILIILGPNNRLRILFSNTLSLRPFLIVRDHVSQPYSTAGIVLYILILEFLEFVGNNNIVHNFIRRKEREFCVIYVSWNEIHLLP